MNTAELNDLEQQINTLLQSLERLKSENSMLRTKLNHSLVEKTQLRETTLRTVTKVKNIIRQLREGLA